MDWRAETGPVRVPAAQNTPAHGTPGGPKTLVTTIRPRSMQNAAPPRSLLYCSGAHGAHAEHARGAPHRAAAGQRRTRTGGCGRAAQPAAKIIVDTSQTSQSCAWTCDRRGTLASAGIVPHSLLLDESL